MRPHAAILVAALLLSVATAGCIADSSYRQGPNGQSSTHRSPTHYYRVVQWSAPEPGLDAESWFNPFPTATFHFTGQVGPGRVRVTITDDAGRAIYENSFYGPSQIAVSGTVVSGREGQWHVSIEKFAASGQVTIQLDSRLG